MAGASLTPRVRLMAICDRVRESKSEPGVFDLRGVRQSLHADAFPFIPSQLWLFLLLSSPRSGVYPGHVVIEHDRTDKKIFFAHLDPHPMFATDGEFWAGRTRIRCSFPEAGRYTVQVSFFRQEGPDVVKGEMPLFLAKERE